VAGSERPLRFGGTDISNPVPSSGDSDANLFRRFRDPATPRSGLQAALGADLREFLDGLGINYSMLVGYDWGGHAACVAAALWPERARGLVSIKILYFLTGRKIPAG
jgi:pimeloyl-ACP methyl ester carboxylesterase